MNNEIFIGGDGIAVFASKLFFNESIRNLDFPLWSPYLANGVPFALDMGNNAFYPFAYLLAFFPDQLSIYSYYGLHLAIGGIFMFSFLQELKCSRWIALCTSILYIFSIHMGSVRKEHSTLIFTALYVPVILFFIQKYINSRNVKWLLTCSIAMAFQFLGGFTQYVVYSNIVVFIYLLSNGLHNKFPLKKILTDGLIWGFAYLGMIFIQLSAMMAMVMEYTKNGSSVTSYDYFVSLSMHPVKLLMMLFPKIFYGEIFLPLHEYGNYSSGIDNEIFLGILVFTFITFSLWHWRQDFIIKLCTLILIGTFVYACMGQFFIFSKIIYHIPILGSFRVPARMLFLFTFFCYVVFAVGLTKMAKEKPWKQMDRFNIIMTILIILTIAGRIIFKLKDETFLSIMNEVFLLHIAIFAAYLLVFYGFRYKSNKINLNTKIVKQGLLLLLVCATLIEVIPYYRMTPSTSSMEIFSKTKKIADFKSDLKNQKVFATLSISEDIYARIITSNICQNMKIQSLHSYMALNNPKLYKLFYNNETPRLNSSGLFISYNNPKLILYNKESVLSMLGVKYISDENKSVNSETKLHHIFIVQELNKISYNKEIVIPETHNKKIFAYASPVVLKPYTYYKYEADIESEGNIDFFYADLAGGPAYDYIDSPFQVKKGKSRIVGLMNSDDISKAKNGIYFRIVTIPTSSCIINNLTLTEMETITENKPNPYIPYIITDTSRIYLNKNAKDILYIPKEVQTIEDINTIYSNPGMYNISEISYVKNVTAMKTGDAEIEVLRFSNNGIKARVTAKEASFINFSQNFFTGWNAYIDGKKTPVHEVNGLIMGINIPQGEHIIEFKFQPMILIIGGVVSFITLMLVLMGLIYKKNSNYT